MAHLYSKNRGFVVNGKRRIFEAFAKTNTRR